MLFNDIAVPNSQNGVGSIMPAPRRLNVHAVSDPVARSGVYMTDGKGSITIVIKS